MTGYKTLTLAVVTAVAMLWGAATVASAAPLMTYTTGLDVWFDASDMNGNGDNNLGWTDGNTLSTNKTWVNKGSVGNPDAYAWYDYGTPTPSNPVYRASVTYPIGGTGPTVEFTFDNFRLPEFMDSPNVSIFAVVQRTANGVGDEPILFDYGSSGNQMINFRLKSGSVQGSVRDQGKNSMAAAGTSNIATSVAIVEMFVDSANQTLEVGPLGFTSTATNALYSATTWIGTTFPPVVGTMTGHASASYVNGNIFEMLIFDHAVTGADRTAVETYLHHKYITEYIPAGTVFIIK